MPTIEDEIKQSKFESLQVKAHMNVLFTASFFHNRMLAFLKTHGLYHEQFNVLRILRREYPEIVSQREILSRMLNRNSNLTRIIKRLKDKKLVTVSVSPADRREYEISITEEGLKLLDVIDQELFGPGAAPLNNLTDKEAARLNNLLDKMREV
ncbi:MarR family winged helix-turn-helix transcriptional regulator [Chitinophagaceae bacterium MMS25-I14]